MTPWCLAYNSASENHVNGIKSFCCLKTSLKSSIFVLPIISTKSMNDFLVLKTPVSEQMLICKHPDVIKSSSLLSTILVMTSIFVIAQNVYM